MSEPIVRHYVCSEVRKQFPDRMDSINVNNLMENLISEFTYNSKITEENIKESIAAAIVRFKVTMAC